MHPYLLFLLAIAAAIASTVAGDIVDVDLANVAQPPLDDLRSATFFIFSPMLRMGRLDTDASNYMAAVDFFKVMRDHHPGRKCRNSFAQLLSSGSLDQNKLQKQVRSATVAM
jgi:hypothetical protein